MENLFISLLPYIIGSAVVPLQIILSLLLLKSPQQGLLKAIAFVVGMTLTRILQGLVFGFIFARSSSTITGDSGSKNLVVATLLLILGILLLIAAYKKWRKEEDPDDPPPRWIARLDQMTPLKALGIGISLPLIAPKLWVFTLSALATIASAQLPQPTSAIAFLLFVLLAESLLILPILIRILIPQQSQAILNEISTWLTRKNRPITIAVSLIFGLWFLTSGIKGFVA